MSVLSPQLTIACTSQGVVTEYPSVLELCSLVDNKQPISLTISVGEGAGTLIDLSEDGLLVRIRLVTRRIALKREGNVRISIQDSGPIATLTGISEDVSGKRTRYIVTINERSGAATYVARHLRRSPAR